MVKVSDLKLIPDDALKLNRLATRLNVSREDIGAKALELFDFLLREKSISSEVDMRNAHKRQSYTLFLEDGNSDEHRLRIALELYEHVYERGRSGFQPVVRNDKREPRPLDIGRFYSFKN